MCFEIHDLLTYELPELVQAFLISMFGANIFPSVNPCLFKPVFDICDCICMPVVPEYVN